MIENIDMQFGEMLGIVLLTLNLLWTVFWSIKVRNQMLAATDDKKLTDYHTRLVKLESITKRLPGDIATHGDIDHLHARVSSMGEKVGGLGNQIHELIGMMKSIDKNLDLLNKSEFLKKEAIKND